ncbi:Uu.00g114670.m01.CDS01 [Anthostomella pinea]|uniref:Uu.00g114670.m01.CDS01 n=1 Tax=Anthostomella pinea TaxID=933095 RepID=A0AAI8VFL0_9PEZI|nr:Uu.00g114670.m01.CDS01 [Anthostomella pinea]
MSHPELLPTCIQSLPDTTLVDTAEGDQSAFLMEQPIRRRRRPTLACIPCRQRKIKCDRINPCRHCAATETQCVYAVHGNEPLVRQRPPPGNSEGSTSSPPASVHSPGARIQQTITARGTAGDVGIQCVTQLPAAAAAQQTGTPSTLRRPGSPAPSRSQDAELDIRDLLQRVQKLEERSASTPARGLPETGQDIVARQDSQITLNKTRILGWSHWMGKAQEFGTIGACFLEAGKHGKAPSAQGGESTGALFAEAGSNGRGPSFQTGETAALVARMGELMQTCKAIAKSMKRGRPSRCLSCPGSGLAPPSREVADTMAGLYFRHFESTHRILHVPTFWTEYSRYWDDPQSVPTGVRVKILLVIGVGSSLCDHTAADSGLRNMVHQWVYTAQTWLSGPLEKDRLDITGLQVHCLTVLARQIFSIGGDLVWMSMGSLIHRAMQIGLHRDPKHLPTMSVLQAELRRRLWATILELVVQSSLDSAMPPRISFDEFDTEAPSNNNDYEMDESTMVLQPHPKETYTGASMQLILLDSLPTRLRILQLLNGLNTELSYLDVIALSSEIADACRACGNFMKKNEASGVTTFHRNLVDFLVRRFLIPLHRPFASKARTNPLFHYSLKISLDVAMAIISPEPDVSFSRIMAIGGALFKEGTRYASAVVSLEFLVHVEAQRLDGTLHRSSQHREFLKQAMRDLISLSIERIRQGETNIKSHMFLSMVMAQIEAAEADIPCELKVAQSAVDSLEFCHGILQTMAGTVSPTCMHDAGPMSTSLDGSLDGSQDFDWDLDLELFLPDADFA